MPHIEPYSDSEIDIATRQALVTLIWQAGDITDEQGESTLKTWDELYDPEDFTPEQVAVMRSKLQSFMERCLMDLTATGHNAGIENNIGRLEQIGHDYILTTGGHGAGFWDRGYGEAGDRLSEVCRAERAEWSLYEASQHVNGEPGKIYCDELNA